MRRAPRFWTNPAARPGALATLLTPLSMFYAAETARRVRKPPDYVAECPVICVGNINAGGTGKTPTAIALVERLSNKQVHIVSRGYGGSEVGPTLVSEAHHSARDVGDEPLLLAAFAPTWVAQDRAAGVKAAEGAGAEVIIFDDGFQNPSVAKSLSIVVVDADVGFGNGRVIPAGPLREPVKAGLERADLVLSVGNPKAQAKFTSDWGALITVPMAKAALVPLETGMDWKGLPVLAFAGIGRPEKFFATIRGLGANVLRAEALGDHQPLTDALMKRLELEAQALGAQLVTTEKDAVRLPKPFKSAVLTVPVRLRIEDDQALADALKSLTFS